MRRNAMHRHLPKQAKHMVIRDGYRRVHTWAVRFRYPARLKIGDQAEVPLFDRQRSRCDRPKSWAGATCRISGIERDLLLVDETLIAHIVDIETAARLKSVEHRLFARPQDRGREQVESSSLQ